MTSVQAVDRVGRGGFAGDVPKPGLAAYLRSETHQAHQELEQALDLLRPPIERARFSHALCRFYGFHRVWEHAIAHAPFKDFWASRSRLPLLRNDLAALGFSEDEIAALPVCRDATALTESETAALGSSYVIEGSALGGRVISRQLADQPWVPAGGLSYFNPYGDNAGPIWQDFRAWCDAQGARLDWPGAAQSARATFSVLQGWLST